MTGNAVNWLVVGAGQAGRGHVGAIEKSKSARLAGIVDPVARPDQFSAPVFADIESALAQIKPDAAVIAAPNRLHVELASRLVDSGVAVLCEKPVGMSADDALAIAGRAAAKGIPAGAVFNQRLQTSMVWVRDLIAARTITPVHIAFTGSLRRLGGWHADVDQSGGGALRTLGIHYVDLLVWWLGTPVKFSSRLIGGRADTAAQVDFRFANGCDAELRLDARNEASKGAVKCVIDAGEALILIDGHRVVVHDHVPAPPDAEPAEPGAIYGPGHAKFIATASNGLLRGEGFPVTLNDAMPTLRLVDALYDAGDRPIGP